MGMYKEQWVRCYSSCIVHHITCITLQPTSSGLNIEHSLKPWAKYRTVNIGLQVPYPVDGLENDSSSSQGCGKCLELRKCIAQGEAPNDNRKEHLRGKEGRREGGGEGGGREGRGEGGGREGGGEKGEGGEEKREEGGRNQVPYENLGY